MLGRLILALLVVALLGLGALFAYLNPGALSLDLGVVVWDTRVTYALIGCLAVGWVLGVMTAAWWGLGQLRRRRRLARELRAAEAETANARSIAAADDL